MVEKEFKVFHVVLTEDEFISLANLNVTLRENSEGLKQVKDFESDDMSVNDAVECGLPGLEAVLTQIEW